MQGKRNDAIVGVDAQSFGRDWILVSHANRQQAALQRRGIRATAPGEADIDRLHAIIFPNLENGLVIPEDKEKMIEITERYIAAEKIDAVILGCTEIPLMIKEGDLSVPSVNTTEIHIAAIAAYMTKGF